MRTNSLYGRQVYLQVSCAYVLIRCVNVNWFGCRCAAHARKYFVKTSAGSAGPRIHITAGLAAGLLLMRTNPS